MNIENMVKEMLCTTLYLEDGLSRLNSDTELFGSLPEFDSIAVVSIITAIEEQLDCIIEDEEITADIFETVGSLTSFVESKLVDG